MKLLALGVLLMTVALVGCSSPSSAPEVPTPTAGQITVPTSIPTVMPTSTSVPPTATATAEPTTTPIPTATPIPPTATPTSTPLPTPTPTPEYTYIGPGENKSQILASDLILTLDKSPYLLIGEVQIPLGVNITVDPGVELKGESPGKSKIRLAGMFYAVGTKSQPVILDWFTIAAAGIPGEDDVTDEEKITITHANVRISMATFSKAKVTDSVIYQSGFTATKGLILKRNIFRTDLEYPDRTASNMSVGSRQDTQLLIVNNCFVGTHPKVWDVKDRVDYLIQHNTFDATNAPTGGAEWFMMSSVESNTSQATKDVSIANNYWYGLGNKPITDFLMDANSDIIYQAKFITTPVLTEPHPDTPNCGD
ncbi:MAG: hypothetical protein CL777_06325 [Chloroflexi bacterium]|nr:hypothetical protein [Chloroflexota bacterium]